MNRRAQTNLLLYQARLMLEQSEQRNREEALSRAAEEAAVVFMHRAFRGGLAEVGAAYDLDLRADESLAELLKRLGEHRPDGWEYRFVVESLRQPDHWMSRLRLSAENWTLTSAPKPVRSADGSLITTVSLDNEDHTNRYRSWLAELQQWIDEVRELGDFS